MIEIRDIQKGDIEYIRQNPLEEAVKSYPVLPTPDSNSFTGLWNGDRVGVGGVVILWEGVGELWLILSKDFKGLGKVAALVAIQDKIEEIIKENNLRRIQAAVRTDFPQAVKMIEYFGFEREGLLKQYCPDKGDVYVYARII